MPKDEHRGYLVTFRVKVFTTSQDNAVIAARDYAQSVLNEDGGYQGELAFTVEAQEFENYDVADC